MASVHATKYQRSINVGLTSGLLRTLQKKVENEQITKLKQSNSS